MLLFNACSSNGTATSEVTYNSEERSPSSVCSTTKCQRMDQLQDSLKDKKKAFNALPDSLKPNHDLPTEEWPQPSRQEIALDRVKGEISAFVCDYNVKSSTKDENKYFLKFITSISDDIGSGSVVSDMYGCFSSLYKTHQKQLEPMVQSLGLSKEVLQMIEEGKTPSGDVQ